VSESSSVEQRCYRHPDREAYIRCQRCERLICPDCMRDASVGFQCPSCIAEGAKSVRTPRTIAGGTVSARPGVATFTIIGVNVVVFLLTLAWGGTRGTLFDGGAMIAQTAQDASGNVLTGVSDGGYWRLLTAAFLHSGAGHLIFNMFTLVLFGPMVEQILGVRRFVAAYLTTAIGSSVFVYWLSPPLTPTIGASGAVFGVLGLTLVLLIRTGNDLRGLLVLLAINAFYSLRPGISWEGHLGGFVVGVVLGAVLAYAPRENRTTWQVGGFVVVWVAMLIAVLARTAQLS
jgi:membrane associated rhomboid family serine protease